MILTIYSVIIIIFLFLIYYFFIRKNYFFLIISFFVGILTLFLTFSYINVVIAIISEHIAIDIMKGLSKALTGNCAECCPIEETTIQVLDMIRQQVDCNALEVFKDSNRNMVGSGGFSTVLDLKTGKIFSRICLGSNEVNALVNKNSIPLPFRSSVIYTLQNKCFCYETSSHLKEAFDSIKDIIKK
jgi:hypothetical protein